MNNLVGKTFFGMTITYQKGVEENATEKLVTTNKDLLKLKDLQKSLESFPNFDGFVKNDLRQAIANKRQIVAQKVGRGVEFSYPLSRSSCVLLGRGIKNNKIKHFVEQQKGESFVSLLKKMKELRGKEVRVARAQNKEQGQLMQDYRNQIQVATPDAKVDYENKNQETFILNGREYYKGTKVEPKLLNQLSRYITAKDGSRLRITSFSGSFNEKDFILTLSKVKKAPTVYSEKKPTTNENHVGIEIEFYSKADEKTLALELTKSGIGEWGNLKGDASLNNSAVPNTNNSKQHYGQELTICVPESKMEEVVEKACGMLNKIGAKVNATCGLHVHIDVRNRTKEVVFHNLVKAQPLMYAMQPEGRRKSKYCRKQEWSGITDAITKGAAVYAHNSRRVGVNPESVQKHNTIEMRMHSGTTNPIKIINWVKMLVAIADKKTIVASDINTSKEYNAEFAVTKELINYMNERVEKFKKKEENENEVSGTNVA